MFGIDEYSDRTSLIAKWDVRLKLIGFLVLVFAFAYVRDLRMLIAMLVTTAAIYTLSRLPVIFWLKRMRYPSVFLLAIVLILILLSEGDVVASLGPFDLHKEGLYSALLIAIRFVSILTVVLVLFGTSPFLKTIKAMRALRLPTILADMVLLTFRYLNELGDDLRRMRVSMKIRGFRSKHFSIRGLRTLAWVGGSLLVHSYERADIVYKAMILRGYGNIPRLKEEFKSTFYDWLALVALLAIAAGFAVGDLLLGHQTATWLQ